MGGRGEGGGDDIRGRSAYHNFENFEGSEMMKK